MTPLPVFPATASGDVKPLGRLSESLSALPANAVALLVVLEPQMRCSRYHEFPQAASAPESLSTAASEPEP